MFHPDVHDVHCVGKKITDLKTFTKTTVIQSQ